MGGEGKIVKPPRSLAQDAFHLIDRDQMNPTWWDLDSGDTRGSPLDSSPRGPPEKAPFRGPLFQGPLALC